MSRTVVPQRQWMVYGDICHPLSDVTDRIPPRRHDITQQLVRFRYHTGGTVNKARLGSAQHWRVTCPLQKGPGRRLSRRLDLLGVWRIAGDRRNPACSQGRRLHGDRTTIISVENDAIA